jgi:integrase
MCKPHQCKPYKASGIRSVHWILSDAFDAAVRWGWIGVNPADVARKQAMPTAKPGPPTAQEAAQLVNEAWERGPDWGVFVWTAMTTGARRGELCALHWYHLELDNSVVVIERAIGKGENGEWVEKDIRPTSTEESCSTRRPREFSANIEPWPRPKPRSSASGWTTRAMSSPSRRITAHS